MNAQQWSFLFLIQTMTKYEINERDSEIDESSSSSKAME